MKCDICEKELVINLYPDFSSSGMWCNNCGVNFANPKTEFPHVPSELIDLIANWVSLWEDASYTQHGTINDKSYEDDLRNMGKTLAVLLEEHQPCVFIEKNIKIDRPADFYRDKNES